MLYNHRCHVLHLTQTKQQQERCNNSAMYVIGAVTRRNIQPCFSLRVCSCSSYASGRMGHAFVEAVKVHLWALIKASCIQNNSLLVVREHIASFEALHKAVIMAAISLADLAMHLQSKFL